MTTTDLAAAILRDVPTLSLEIDGALHDDPHGFYMDKRDVLAALTAALDPALSERAGEVLEGVTDGPWTTGALTTGGSYRYLDAPDWGAFASVVVKCDGEPQAAGEANARFIAWCREGVPALLAQNAALRADKEALHLALGEASKTIVETKAERDNLSDKLELERALTDGAHRRARAAEAQNAALTARVEGLTGAVRRLRKLADEIEQQVQTTRAYAADSGMDRHQVDLMATCTSHFIDYARTLRAALSATTEEGK